MFQSPPTRSTSTNNSPNKNAPRPGGGTPLGVNATSKTSDTGRPLETSSRAWLQTEIGSEIRCEHKDITIINYESMVMFIYLYVH